MCGRYTITKDPSELGKLIRFISRIGEFKPRYNLAPRQHAPVFVWEDGRAVLKPMRWGLIPPSAKDESIGDQLATARAETLTDKTSFRRPFEKQRCLVPADGFYEWDAAPDGKQPFRFTRKGGGFFCMAGLWEKWHRPHREGELGLDDTGPGIDQTLETFTIITTKANSVVAQVHDRMPVILAPDHYHWWLQPDRFELQFLKTLLRPYPAEDMASHRVNHFVNDARFDGPACLKPA